MLDPKHKSLECLSVCNPAQMKQVHILPFFSFKTILILSSKPTFFFKVAAYPDISRLKFITLQESIPQLGKLVQVTLQSLSVRRDTALTVNKRPACLLLSI